MLGALCLFVAGLGALPSPPAPRLAIVAGLISEQPGAGDAEKVAEILRASHAAMRYVADTEVLPLDELEDRLGPRLAYCRADPVCRTQRLTELGVSYLLEILCNSSLGVCSAELHDVATGTSLARLVETDRLDSPRAAQVALLVGRVLSAGRREIGAAVKVRTVPADARIKLEPEPLRPSEEDHTFIVRAGGVHLTVEANGFAGTQLDLQLDPATETVVNVTLDPEGITSSPWLWVGIGVGTAAVVTALVVLLVPHNTQRFLCQAPSPADCPPL